jgi:hypothetical protein|tara:strand:- start:67711 stop:67827 length:117 start_codon:yes stop_codon:yes gene_type:complete
MLRFVLCGKRGKEMRYAGDTKNIQGNSGTGFMATIMLN